MDQQQLSAVGITKPVPEHVLALARLTQDSDLDGVVCSAQEAGMLKAELGQKFQLVTPGIRPLGSDVGDQKRIMTPPQAIKAGVDYMVIGRPITKSVDPAASLAAINASLA